MSILQNRIVNSLTNSFILNRAIDPTAVAGVLGKEFPELSTSNSFATSGR